MKKFILVVSKLVVSIGLLMNVATSSASMVSHDRGGHGSDRYWSGGTESSWSRSHGDSDDMFFRSGSGSKSRLSKVYFRDFSVIGSYGKRRHSYGGKSSIWDEKVSFLGRYTHGHHFYDIGRSYFPHHGSRFHGPHFDKWKETPPAVPVPPAFILLGSAIAALLLVRRFLPGKSELLPSSA